MNRRTMNISLGLVFAAAGCAVVARGLWKYVPVTAPRLRSRSESVGASAVTSYGSLGPFETEVTPGTRAEVLSSMAEKLKTAVAAPDVGARTDSARMKLLGDEAIRDLSIVLGGTFEQYLDAIRERGGVPAFNPEDPAGRTDLVQGFEFSQMAFRDRPISLDRLAVRTRVLGGRAAPIQDTGLLESWTTLESRYPVLRDVGSTDKYGYFGVNTDAYEVLLPVNQRMMKKDREMILGLWYAWVPSKSRWVPCRISMYTLGHSGDVLLPPF